MNWRIKGVTQKILSNIPGGVAVNDYLQASLGDLRNLDGNIHRKLSKDWVSVMKFMRDAGHTVTGKTMVEIGSGWYPTLPTAFYLAGAAAVHTFDLNRHMNPEKTLAMIRHLGQHLPMIAEASGCSLEAVSDRYERISDVSDLGTFLKIAGIHYHAPADATATGFADSSVDIVFSNSVFEHVPGWVIAKMMTEGNRILRTGGIAVHCVACNDHYAHFDRNISFVNFYRYSEKEWKRWNNDLNYQNRLRPSDFRQMTKAAGLDIVFEATAIRPGTREALQRLPIAPEFRHYSEEDLSATTINFIAMKAAQRRLAY